MPRIIKRPLAETDLIDIWLFITEDSVINADAYLRRIEQLFRVLADQPLMGQNRNEIADSIKSFPIESHVIFYYALDDGIDIVRVLHGARDIEAVFYNKRISHFKDKLSGDGLR